MEGRKLKAGAKGEVKATVAEGLLTLEAGFRAGAAVEDALISRLQEAGEWQFRVV